MIRLPQDRPYGSSAQFHSEPPDGERPKEGLSGQDRILAFRIDRKRAISVYYFRPQNINCKNCFGKEPVELMAETKKRAAAADTETLNFRVESAFKKEFKGYAASHGVTMVELLKEGFELSKRKRKR